MSTAGALDAPIEDDLDNAAIDEAAIEGPVCSECQGPLPTEQTTVCPHCGWYASLGIHVDVSREFEEAANGCDAPSEQPSMLEVWSNLIPLWGWVMIGTAVSITVGSLAVRLTYPEAGGLRTTWAVTQLIAGLSVAVVCHLVTFVMVSTSDPDMGIADIIISPFKAWKKVLCKLPKRLTIVNSANASLLAAICAAGIIGGIPYERLLDWGFTAPVKSSLMGAVMNRAKDMGGPEMSMEEAMSSFAGDAAGDRDLSGLPDPSNKPPEPLVRKTTDALILGYEADANGNISQLLIATERKSKLVYSGRVTPKLNKEELAMLSGKLRTYRAPRPIINVPTTNATWVQPRLTCRVSYEKRVESGLLKDLLWVELLSEVQLPW